MIEWKGRGDLLKQTEHTQLCPINAVGAMGKGLARTMRVAHPGLWEAYDQVYNPWHGASTSMLHRARILTHVELPTGKVLLFCSKYHWRNPSPLELVRDNLEQLAERWESLGITQLAMPRPGTGEGKLPIADVDALIEQYLGESCALPVRLYLGT